MSKEAPSSHYRPPTWLEDLGWSHRYKPIRIIGSGGMGQVWYAMDLTSRSYVALKIVDPARSGDDHLLARFEAEAAALRCILNAGQHPNIVPVLDFKVTESHACLVMDYIPGTDLLTWCDLHNLDTNARVALLVKAAFAAGCCHRHHIVHRDLKPANILVHSASGQPVVVDFSIAKIADPLNLTMTNEALGTTPYTAPEQLDRTRGPITPAADVYSLGATLYQLITHVLPHPGSLAQVIRRHQNDVPPARPSLLNTSISRDLESICLKALSNRASDRYPNGDEFAADLERYLTDRPVKAHPLSLYSRILRHTRRQPSLIAALIACLVISALAAWSVLRVQQERLQRQLERDIASAMQGRTWPKQTLQQTHTWLAQLTAQAPDSASKLRNAVQADILNDVRSALQQPYIQSPDVAWMREVSATWLKGQREEDALRLERLVNERIARWQPLVSLHPPFTDLQGLFPTCKMRTEGDLLYPAHESMSTAHISNSVPTVVVKDSLIPPFEVSATFVAPPQTFSHVALGFEFEKIRTDVILFRVPNAPESILAKFADRKLHPQGLILATVRARYATQAVYINDPTVLHRPFKLTVSIDRNHLDADLNGQWNLPMSDIFALTITAPKNTCQISWQRDIGLRDLSIRSRMAGQPNPLEQGDLFYSQNKWREAQRLYEGMKGDPIWGGEASFKAALTQAHLNQSQAARAEWDRLSQGAPGLWRDLSSTRLWIHTALKQGAEAARPYLQRLPAVADLDPVIKTGISKEDSTNLIDIYRRSGQGLNTLRFNPEQVEDSVKALQIVGVDPVEITASLALAHHFSGMDTAARNLFSRGLGQPNNSANSTVQQHSAVFALNHWTFISRTENDQHLRRIFKAWHSTYPQNTEIQVFTSQEITRSLCRSQQLERALKTLKTTDLSPNIEPRQLIAGSLLEGMILHDLNRKPEALAAWQRGTAAASQVAFRSPMHLCDLAVLHSIAGSWSLESCTNLLPRIISRGTTGKTARAMERTFVSSILAKGGLVEALNSLSSDPRCADLARHYAYRTLVPRELVRRWSALVLDRYFLHSAFPTQPSAEIRQRVSDTATMLVDTLAISQEFDSSYYLSFRAWGNPETITSQMVSSITAPPALAARVKWLFAQRYLNAGMTSKALPVLQSIKDDPSLAPSWRASIASQLGAPHSTTADEPSPKL